MLNFPRTVNHLKKGFEFRGSIRSHQVLEGSQYGSSNDAQENSQHIEHYISPQQSVQVYHVPATIHTCKLKVVCVVPWAGETNPQTFNVFHPVCLYKGCKANLVQENCHMLIQVLYYSIMFTHCHSNTAHLSQLYKSQQ